MLTIAFGASATFREIIDMREVIIENKVKYLEEHYPFIPKPSLREKRRCIHCDKIIIVGNFKVFTDGRHEFICCPNAPACDGTVIDWW